MFLNVTNYAAEIFLANKSGKVEMLTQQKG